MDKGLQNINGVQNISKQSKAILNAFILVISKIASINKILTNNNKKQTYVEVKNTYAKPYSVLIYGKLLTFYRVINGYTLDDLHPKIKGISYDTITLYDLRRSIYETLLQANFINKRYLTEDEAHYFLLWFNSRAVSERRRLANTSHLEHQKLEDELKSLNINFDIISTKYEDLLKNDIKDYGKDTQTKLANWPKPSKLYECANIHKSHHDFNYKYLSIYAHTEPLAILQTMDLIEDKNIDMDSIILLHGYPTINLALKHVCLLSEQFQNVRDFIDEDKDFKIAIEEANIFFSIDRAERR